MAVHYPPAIKNEIMMVVSRNSDQQIHTAALRLEVKKRSDKLMNYFLISFFIGGLVLASFYDTWLVAFGIGGLSLLAYYSAKMALPNSNLYQYVLSVVLGVFMAQYIYQMHGMFEMHFVAFIGSAILITYQNWKLQIPFALAVVIHHALFGYLQNTGFDSVYFTQLDYFELRTFIIHVLLAAVIFYICGLWAYQLRKYSEIQIGQSMEMGRMQKEAIVAATERERQMELLKTQQELADSNKRFTYATQATSDAIWDYTYPENAVYWGDGFKALFGYDKSPETSSINFWKSKVHPDDMDRVMKIIQPAKDDPGTGCWKCEYRFLKADGEYAYVKEKAVILRDEDGKPVRMIGALQDITENKKNEIILEEVNGALEKEKYYLDSLMDNMPDAIYFKDKESKFLRVSKYMVTKHMLNNPGATVNDLIGKSDFDFQDEKHANEAFQDEQEIQRTRKPKIDYIEKETLEDGSERWVATTKLPMENSQGEIVGTFGISRDVTNIKVLEKERHEADLEKAVAQGKFEIAADVMHDVGNAVVGFGSYLTRIRRMQEENHPANLESLAEYLNVQHPALTSALGEEKATAVIKMMKGISLTQKTNQEEMNKTIEDQFNIIGHIQEILNIQRQYISGRESQERKPVNLRSLVTDAVSMLNGTLDKMAISVSSDMPLSLPHIRGDRTKLMQVILNLLKNSIEAIDKDAANKNISISAEACPEKLAIQIRDNGAGFDPSVSGQLFRRGFTTKSAGTGLGLYNCRSILESHDGCINITSEGKGKGTLATINFKV
jgi:PAS domain S-box-containing protein